MTGGEPGRAGGSDLAVGLDGFVVAAEGRHLVQVNAAGTGRVTGYEGGPENRAEGPVPVTGPIRREGDLGYAASRLEESDLVSPPCLAPRPPARGRRSVSTCRQPMKRLMA